MRVVVLLFQVSSFLILFQLVTGGPTYILNSDIAGGIHFFFGLITFIFLLAAAVATWISKPADKRLRISGLILLILIVLVGFTTKGSPLEGGTILNHYELAIITFAGATATSFNAFRWSKMVPAKPAET
jgi:hypothetical protein